MSQKQQKNFNKIPQNIRTKLAGIESDEIVIASVVKVPASMISAGDYDHLGMRLVNGEVDYETRVIPLATQGRFSYINLKGKEVKRTDLPKESRSYSVEVPNWGDWSYGSHEMSWEREVYQIDFIPPKELDIKIRLLDVDTIREEKHFVLKFEVSEVISRSDEYADDDIFYNLNLLQENVGAVNVFSADASDEEYLQTLYVDWELIPIGTDSKETVFAKVERKYRNVSEDVRARMQSRYDLLMSH